KVGGAVRGYAANRVVSQTPAAGTKLKDTGAPLITVTLARTGYAETGQPEDVSPYMGTAVVPATPVATAPVQVAPVTSVAERKVSTKPVAKPAAKPAAKPSKRPPAFTVPGAPAEPLKEMPLADRARLLQTWLVGHPKPTNANVRHFLYQNAWIVTGAKFGW